MKVVDSGRRRQRVEHPCMVIAMIELGTLRFSEIEHMNKRFLGAVRKTETKRSTIEARMKRAEVCIDMNQEECSSLSNDGSECDCLSDK